MSYLSTKQTFLITINLLNSGSARPPRTQRVHVHRRKQAREDGKVASVIANVDENVPCFSGNKEGGEELGGLRGLDFYMQRTAIQGDRGALNRMLGATE